MAATLDGVVEATGAVFEAKFMLPWSFREQNAAENICPSFSTTCGWCTRRLGRVDSLDRPTQARTIDAHEPPKLILRAIFGAIDLQ
jgi:hypothetical protein